MTAPANIPHTINRNGIWCEVIVDALVDIGLRDVVLCPSSRNSMMALTLHGATGLTCLAHIDERSAAFIALGIAAATNRPVAICTTSGSAVANLLPALTEAAPRRMPLILLTCDRPVRDRPPHELQTTEQLAFCRPLLQGQLALDDPSDDRAALTELRREVLALLRGPSGPVQINIPQIGAYCATEEEPGWSPRETPNAIRIGVAVSPPDRPATACLEDVTAALDAVGARPGLRGLILAGPDTPLGPAALARLVRITGFPLMADAASGLRNAALPALSTGDLLVHSPSLGFGRTELLIRIGGAPVSFALQQALAGLCCPVLRVASHDPGPDSISRFAHGLLPPSKAGQALLAQRLSPGDDDWARRWAAAEAASANQREKFIARLPWGEIKAASLICNATGFGMMHFGNSLSVRHASLVMKTDQPPCKVFVARGVNGIDGTLGQFLGELLGSGCRGLALIGDQTAVHDLPALANPAWRGTRGAICIMNNGGGGIFDLAACARLPGYLEVMRNAPMIDFRSAAATFGLRHLGCADASSLARALEEAACGNTLVMIEVLVPPHTARRDVPRLSRAMVV